LLSHISLKLFTGPYHFRGHHSVYDFRSISEIANKFGSLTIEDYHNLEELFANDKVAYLAKAEGILPHSRVFEDIRKRILNNHHMNKRSAILETALTNYESNKELFCNIIPQQIEGILYNYALEIGIPDKSLSNSSISEKLQHIIEKVPFFYEDEYYLFFFPVIRNRIAHGKLINDNFDLLAYHLLLDLNHISSLLEDDDNILLNKAIKCIRSLNDTPSLFDLLKFAIYYEVDIPDFYKLNSRIDYYKQKCLQEFIWDGKLDTIASHKIDEINSGLLKIATNLKPKFNSKEFAKVLKIVKSESTFNDNDFLTAIDNLAEVTNKMARESKNDGQTIGQQPK
jgi:hypothetical protein